MTTILSEGVIVPDAGDVNWAGKLEVNWNLLNGALANLSGNVKTDRDNTWTGEQSFTLPIVGSITGTAAKAIADEDGTSIKTGYVNVAGNQTVSGDKSWTGSNAFNNILPNATNTYSLGSSSYQWSSVYAQTYYYNGTAWGLDKANTWTGSNTFSHLNRKFWSVEKGVLPTTNNDRYTYFLDKNGATLGYTQISYNTAGNIVYSVWLLNSFSNGQLDPTGTDRYAMIGLTLKGDGSRFFSVYADAIPNNTGWFNLGTSTNKWKTLNGVNPGALSLPDYDSSAKIDISGSLIPDQYGNIYYTPTINGWLYVCFNISSATTTDPIFYIQAKDNNVANSSFIQTSWALASVNPVNLAIFFPVIANKRFIMQINFSNYTIIKAHVIPCLGNV